MLPSLRKQLKAVGSLLASSDIVEKDLTLNGDEASQSIQASFSSSKATSSFLNTSRTVYLYSPNKTKLPNKEGQGERERERERERET